jgi:hypothetical protein
MNELVKTEEQALTQQDYNLGFNSNLSFELMQRVAKMFASSALVPDTFKGNLANCVIALELANRIGASPLAVMQNIYIVHGKPSWSAQFVIAAINSTGRFSPVRFKFSGEGDARQCVAWVRDNTGEIIESPAVSIKMAKAEGWFSKSGSKWQTMPDLMSQYRAATFLARTCAPEVLMGMTTREEIYDTVDEPRQEPSIQIEPEQPTTGIDKLKKKLGRPLKQAPESIPVEEPVQTTEEHPKVEPPAQEQQKQADPELVSIRDKVIITLREKNINNSQLKTLSMGQWHTEEDIDREKSKAALNKFHTTLTSAL